MMTAAPDNTIDLSQLFRLNSLESSKLISFYKTLFQEQNLKCLIHFIRDNIRTQTTRPLLSKSRAI